MVNKKSVASIFIIILASLALSLLSSQALILCLFLVFLAYAKHMIYPIKKEFLWFVLIGGGGAMMEILLVNLGSNWQYMVQHFFGIPMWIPFYWGVLGTTVIVLYNSLLEIN